MSEIENKIREYGQKRQQKALQEYVENIKDDQLIDIVHNKLTSPNFIYLWDYIIQSFTDSSESHKKRFNVVAALLHELEKGVLPSSQSNALLTRLCIELPKFKPQHLINLCSFCTERIQKGNVTEMCWKEILPELLNVLVECELVEYNDGEMTGLEYKTQLINSICMLVWSPNIIISLTSMFIDMPLNKDEHQQVVNKLGQYLEKMTCHEVPAYVYQLLKLCRYQHGRSIFLRLQYYFGTRIYNKTSLLQETESESMDMIGDATDQQTLEAESTVLFHIYQSASVGHEGIKDYLSSLKNMLKSPEFVLHPFQFTVLLTIATVKSCEEHVMEILRLSISRALNEDYKKSESCWFREMAPNICKVEEILTQIINISLADRHLVIEGLVELAYILLGVGSMLGRDKDFIAEKQWKLGQMIILKIVKKKRQIMPCIITSLSNRIITGQNVYQYIECIRLLCQKMSLAMLENQSCVITLVEYLVEIPGPVANQLFDALLPLTKISSTIRDHLILLLRKSLYSRVTETRQMAVSGFLKLIKSLKISNLAALSQSSSSSSISSGHSLLTQISLTNAGKGNSNPFSNEALCLEVLGILRRCFMQQIEVRTNLYDGLYDAVCLNPELGIPVLDMIWTHFSNFYDMNDESLPPLYFSKIYVTKDLDVIQQEPLGKLVYTIGLLVTKVQEEDSENAVVIRFNNVLDSICTRMINCELINYELDDGTDLLDITPESKQKLLVLKEAMSVCEALIGYKICTWGPNSENNGQQISSLFQSYSRLLDFTKNLTKPKKVVQKNKKNNSSKNTQSDTFAKLNGTQKINQHLKLPKTVLDFQAIGKILHLLHESEVSWAKPADANIVKVKHEFHQHIMQATIQLVDKLRKCRTAEIEHIKMYYNYLTEIAGILYERCITRLNSFIDFDAVTATLVIECFYSIFTVVLNHYRSNLESFLSAVCGKNKDDSLSELLVGFIETYKEIFEMCNDEDNSNVHLKKLPLISVNTIALFTSCIPAEDNDTSSQLLEWLKNFMNKTNLGNKQVVSAFVGLTFNTQLKFKTSLNIFEAIALRLSDVMGTIHDEKPNASEPEIINDATATIVFQLFCTAMKSILDDLDWIIIRLRSEYGMISYPGEDNPERKREYLKSKERGVCCQLCPLIVIIGTLSNVAVPPGNLSELLLKTVTHLYNSLTVLTKYFLLRSSKINLVFQGARFERVVRLAGKQLSSVVYDFIIYIEESYKQETENTQPKKKSLDSNTMKTKVLRETRLIPKLIFEIEQFGKTVIQLSNKTKVDLAKFIGQGTARDFRIKGLKEVLQKSGNETMNISNADTSIGEGSAMEVDEEPNCTGGSSDNESDLPPKKKSRN